VAPRPYVFINMAMTADGKIDTVARQGARISGAADTARVDQLRAGADAVMVGGRTLHAEDPRLTVRDQELVDLRIREGRDAQPMKVGVSSYVECSGERSLPPEGDFMRAGDGRVLVCTSARTDARTVAALTELGVEVVVTGVERVDLAGALAALATRGVERLMVEGGSTLVASLLGAGLVDELQLAVAPLIFGGETAPTPVGGPGWSREEARDLYLVEAETSPDGDVVLRYLTHAGPVA
jgi:2,5-diamino-6-(ribosylamino)-4(3H)-pyrimidinone 5'-phosphate reductase